ncbi:GNAT family N-acetyltransferase [Thiomicrorhabdus sediminis]|uniref:N-acetyltransferase n=1 Tax=Thiomicrorhabdus sediminis TaxID=2580412 RepID=A0A4P9K6I6_9GAMM|nr:GNAT family N-acetyltransferase [Thiomicrorhabdus sediminis]QCU90070.1 N-acetyltransferase [Thiomicrorhabdus sediminis]
MDTDKLDFQIEIHNQIAEIDADQWNRLIKHDYPFAKHQFLKALEDHQCVGKRFGWIAHHIAIFAQSANAEKTLIAAMPVYEKHNNYGEFVFDQAWEQAWNHIGLNYYPKLVCAIPYTPALGPRLLVDRTLDSTSQKQLQQLLINEFKALAKRLNMSGSHLLFAEHSDQVLLKTEFAEDFIKRRDCQFHWHNQNYQSFADFLSQLKAKKRKNIRQERNSIAKANIQFRILSGHQASKQDWQEFDYFYQKTFIEKWSTPTLNLGFFQQIGQTMPDNIVLLLAEKDGKTLAGALLFRSQTHLYGRHWGAAQEIKNLHFETCFYQGIDYAIKHKLMVFEPGAGGEHKIARGFSPVITESFHYLTENPFKEALQRFVYEEKVMIADYADDCLTHSPYSPV